MKLFIGSVILPKALETLLGYVSWWTPWNFSLGHCKSNSGCFWQETETGSSLDLPARQWSKACVPIIKESTVHFYLFTVDSSFSTSLFNSKKTTAKSPTKNEFERVVGRANSDKWYTNQPHNQRHRETQRKLNMRAGVHVPSTSHEAVGQTTHDAIFQVEEDWLAQIAKEHV